MTDKDYCKYTYILHYYFQSIQDCKACFDNDKHVLKLYGTVCIVRKSACPESSLNMYTNKMDCMHERKQKQAAPATDESGRRA